MSVEVGKREFGRRLEKYEGRLNTLQREASRNGVSTILLFGVGMRPARAARSAA
jgi:hypothetical protein